MIPTFGCRLARWAVLLVALLLAFGVGLTALAATATPTRLSATLVDSRGDEQDLASITHPSGAAGIVKIRGSLKEVSSADATGVPGGVVLLELSTNENSWTVAASMTADASGTFLGSFTPPGGVKTHLRMVFAGDTTHEPSSLDSEYTPQAVLRAPKISRSANGWVTISGSVKPGIHHSLWLSLRRFKGKTAMIDWQKSVTIKTRADGTWSYRTKMAKGSNWWLVLLHREDSKNSESRTEIPHFVVK